MQTDSICNYPFVQAHISSLGDLSFCQWMKSSVGNVLSNTFDEAWYSDVAEDVRRNLMQGSLHKNCVCKGCPLASMMPPYKSTTVEFNEHPLSLSVSLGLIQSHQKPEVSSTICPCEEQYFADFDIASMISSRISYLTHNIWNLTIDGPADPFSKNNKGDVLLFNFLEKMAFEDHRSRIVLHISSNGSTLSFDVAKQYCALSPKSTTTFFVGACSKESYYTITQYDHYELVIQNIFAFNNIRNKSSQKIKIHNIINGHNISDIKGMISLAQYLEVDELEFSSKESDVNLSNYWKYTQAQNTIADECRKLSMNYRILNVLDYGLSGVMF